MLHNSEFQQTPGNQAVRTAQRRPDTKRLVVTSVVTSLSDSRQVAPCMYRVWVQALKMEKKKKESQVKNNISERAGWEKNGKLHMI